MREGMAGSEPSMANRGELRRVCRGLDRHRVSQSEPRWSKRSTDARQDTLAVVSGVKRVRVTGSEPCSPVFQEGADRTGTLLCCLLTLDAFWTRRTLVACVWPFVEASSGHSRSPSYSSESNVGFVAKNPTTASYNSIETTFQSGEAVDETIGDRSHARNHLFLLVRANDESVNNLYLLKGKLSVTLVRCLAFDHIV